ncbi:hypothetical protein BDR07DRAFT_1405465, partial [Suillus spraguei]
MLTRLPLGNERYKGPPGRPIAFTPSSSADLKVDVHEHAAFQSISTPNRVIHEETVVRRVSHVNDTVSQVRCHPSISHRQHRVSGEALMDKKPRQTTIWRPNQTTTIWRPNQTTTLRSGHMNEKNMDAGVLAYAILDIPLPPATVVSVQLLRQRKWRNSCCSEGITCICAKRRQMNVEGTRKTAMGTHWTWFNYLSRQSP